MSHIEDRKVNCDLFYLQVFRSKNGQNGQKWSKNGQKWPTNGQDGQQWSKMVNKSEHFLIGISWIGRDQGELILKNSQKLPMDIQGFPCVTLTKRYDLVWDSGGAV